MTPWGSVTDHFMILGGLGAFLTADESEGTAALRVIYTF
jgi:hypothetical protein